MKVAELKITELKITELKITELKITELKITKPEVPGDRPPLFGHTSAIDGCIRQVRETSSHQ